MPPEKLPRPCASPGCSELLTGVVSRCVKHRREFYRFETKRRTLNPFYKLAIWTKARAQYIRANPMCEAPECRTVARVVDHIVPIAAGGETLDPENFASLCDRCHNRKRSLEHHYPDFFLDIKEIPDDRRDKATIISSIFNKNRNA